MSSTWQYVLADTHMGSGQLDNGQSLDILRLRFNVSNLPCFPTYGWQREMQINGNKPSLSLSLVECWESSQSATAASIDSCIIVSSNTPNSGHKTPSAWVQFGIIRRGGAAASSEYVWYRTFLIAASFELVMAFLFIALGLQSNMQPCSSTDNCCLFIYIYIYIYTV